MNKLKEHQGYKAAIAFFNRLIIPGFQGVPVGTVMNFFVESLSKGILFHRAAAMTYRVFIALIPLLMALFAGISFLGEDVRLTILNFMESIVPAYVWPAISDMITEVVMKQNGTLLWSSFGFGLIFAIICVNALINIMNTTYYSCNRRRPFLKQLRVVLFILALWFVIILLAVAVFLGASLGFNYLDNHLFQSPRLMSSTLSLVKWLLLFALVYVFISSLYYLAPANRKEYRFFSAGSTFASLAMVLVLGVLNYYFANFSNYNVLYGSLGAILAILLWLYWNALFILIGFDLNISIVQAKRSISDEKENEFNCEINENQ
ncbi:MAG: YihY/virulence factor BrkB family protein [Bacteroidales bacterium]|nr:YihY/virulence factor BrkB family protein [Bacteroidales bacterium]